MTKLQAVVDRFRDGRPGADDRLPAAPREIVQALAALIGDAEVAGSVSVYNLEPADGPEQKSCATWECMALAGGGVVNVSGSRVGGEWYLDNFDDPDSGTAPAVHGSVIPLREVTACRVLNVRSTGDAQWFSQWQLDLRSGDPLVIPWPRHKYGQEQHEALAREVAKQLRSI